MSYNTLYFYLKLPINYPIFCSEYACRPEHCTTNITVLSVSAREKFVYHACTILKILNNQVFSVMPKKRVLPKKTLPKEKSFCSKTNLKNTIFLKVHMYQISDKLNSAIFTRKKVSQTFTFYTFCVLELYHMTKMLVG